MTVALVVQHLGHSPKMTILIILKLQIEPVLVSWHGAEPIQYMLLWLQYFQEKPLQCLSSGRNRRVFDFLPYRKCFLVKSTVPIKSKNRPACKLVGAEKRQEKNARQYIMYDRVVDHCLCVLAVLTLQARLEGPRQSLLPSGNPSSVALM